MYVSILARLLTRSVAHLFIHTAPFAPKSLVEGFPPLKYAVSRSGPSIPRNHDRATFVERCFGLLGINNIVRIPSALWREYRHAIRNGQMGITVSTEADIAHQVRPALSEVIEALGLQFYLLSEVQIFWIRPDIYIVATASGIPKGIVEVKKAGEIAMTNEFIAGEVFDHMMHLHSVFGVRQVFAILTSYDEWRVCWLPDDESNKLAAADSLTEVPVFETPTKAKTGPSEIATNDDSPTLASPSKHIAAHDCRILDDGNDVAEEGDQEIERTLSGSAIWKREGADNGALFSFVSSILIKIDCSSLVNRDLSPGSRVEGIIRVVTPATYLWKHVKLERGLQWDKYPRQGAKRFYIWDDLGHGIDGCALLATTVGGAVCVLKFFFPKAQDDDMQTKAERELKLWHRIYPEYKEYVRVVKLVDRPVLMMPHFASPNRTSDVVEGVRKVLDESFDARELVHADVRWRNIGLRHDGRPLLYDLGHIEEKNIDQHKDWIEKACESLKTKLNE